VVLNNLIHFLPTWGKLITDTIVFPAVKLRYERYAPFLEINLNKFRGSLRTQLMQNK
jgi:hypothetical protein